MNLLRFGCLEQSGAKVTTEKQSASFMGITHRTRYTRLFKQLTSI